MTKFKFKAIDRDGKTYEGVRESSDKFTLYADIKTEGGTLITAAAVDAKKSWLDSVATLFGGVPEHQKIIFTRNLGSMIDAGLPIAKSLAVLEKQTKNKNFKTVIQALGAAIRKGQTLSGAAAMYPRIFPNLFVAMVKAGEESGKLAESLGIVANQMEGTYELKRKVRGAMIYPGVILSVMLVIGILMLVFVVPSITATFESMNVPLPWMTRVMIGTSQFLQGHIVLSLACLLALVGGIYAFKLSKTGKRFFDFLFLRLPVVGELVKETNAARMTRTISSLLSSGVPFSKAISITADVVGNGYFKDILAEASAKVEKGETISSVFLAHTKLCPDFVGEMMSVGEETGRLPSMLLEVAHFYETSVDQKTKDMSTIIEPFLMVLIGTAVGIFALAIIKPIYSLVNVIN